MSKILKPRLKLCKREKMDLFFLSGVTDIKKKCNLNKFNNVKYSDFYLKLREKQKIKRIYGISETQFKKYFLKIKKKEGDRILNLLNLLEMRLDNILYKSGLALSRFHARQLINHKLIYVNEKKVNIPSYLVSIFDVINISKKLKNNIFIKEAIILNKNKKKEWINLDNEKLSFEIISIPNIDYIYNILNKNLILELY